MANCGWDLSSGLRASGNNYKSTFRNAVQEIDNAIQKAKSQFSNGIYSDVRVLCLRWSDEGPDVKLTTDQLLNVFESTYKFPVQTCRIAHQSSTYAADTLVQVGQVVSKIQDPHSLLILIHTGTMEWKATFTGPKTLQLCSNASASARLDWSVIQAALDTFSGHTLVIMDCCDAGAAVAVTQRSAHEYLLTSALESGIPWSIFTKRLAKLLDANKGGDITVSQVHTKLIADAGYPNSFPEMHVVPQHNCSIILRPRKGRNPSVKGEDKESTGEVRISVTLHGEKTVPDPESWKAWLARGIPDDVASLDVQADFCSSDPEPWGMPGEEAGSVSSENDPWGQSLASRREVEATPSATVASAGDELGWSY